MSSFPVLSTAAVGQYPMSFRTSFECEVLKFVDGSEQRYPNYGAPVRRWFIRLDYLNETELATIRQFFRLQNGGAGAFSFTDPLSGTVYNNCSFDQQSLTGELKDVSRGVTTLVVRTNG